MTDIETTPAPLPDALDELRRVSRDVHQRVDQAFSRFDLADAQSYAAMLQAHMGALSAAEHYLEGCPGLPVWRARRDLAADDLARMGVETPDALSFELPQDTPEAWGVLYVLEGSRLGGRVLARRVGSGLPHAYLSASHAQGDWARFLDGLRAYLGGLDAGQRVRVTRAVVAAFDLFSRSAETVLP